MTATTTDFQNHRRAIDLRLDGAPGAPGPDVVGDDPTLEQEERQLSALHRALQSSKIEPRPDLVDRVMEQVSSQPVWNRRRGIGWLPVAIGGVAAVLAFALIGGAGLPGTGIGALLVDYFSTVLLAGSGLLGASWRGLIGSLEQASPGALVALGLLAVGVNYFLIRALRGRRSARVAADRAGRSS